jgi:hypothetical protein
MLVRQAFLRTVENAGQPVFEGAVECRQLERRRRLLSLSIADGRSI